MNLETIIGLEVHVQLKTKSKMFCTCDNRDDQEPNSAICPVCTAHPGTLPVPNGQAIEWAVKTSLALGCTINQHSKFDRKNYFYPDQPKGYQISQYDFPFGVAGSVSVPVDGTVKTFRVHRLHLEEDAGKLTHPDGADYSLVDLNRAGTPLMEIVSEPDFRTPQEAKAYVQELQLMMRYLGVSDADMEKGHLRCDANVSLRPIGEDKLYPKTEIKNMNSFKAIEKALAYEIERQQGLWEDGAAPATSTTRGWNEATGKTEEQRTKEGEADYRYFPEPDIPPVTVTDELIQKLKDEMPELPAVRRERLTTMYGLEKGASEALTVDIPLGKYFEEVVSEYRKYADDAKPPVAWEKEKAKRVKSIANWLTNRITAEDRAAHGLLPANDVARLLFMIDAGTVTVPSAVAIYAAMMTTKKGPHDLVRELGLEQVNDQSAIDAAVKEVIDANAKIVAEVKGGKTAAIQFLVGQVMKTTKGKANPQVVLEALKKALGV